MIKRLENERKDLRLKRRGHIQELLFIRRGN